MWDLGQPMKARRLLFLVLFLGACVESNGDTDTDADSGSTSTTADASTSTNPTAADDTTTVSSDGSSGSSTSAGESSSSGSSGADGSSSTGAAAGDICYGYGFLDTAAQVFTDGTAMGQPNCDTTPAPCGGDVVGTWTGETACGYAVLPNFFAEICAGATQQITGSNLVGTRTFEEDGSFVFDLVLQLEADLQVDSMACAGLDCATFGEALSDEPGLSMSCTSAGGDACDCTYTADLPDTSEGTWAFFDDDLLLTTDDGETLGLFDYCVDASRLTMWIPLFEETAFPDTSCQNDDDCEGQVEGEFDGLGCDPPEDDERG